MLNRREAILATIGTGLTTILPLQKVEASNKFYNYIIASINLNANTNNECLLIKFYQPDLKGELKYDKEGNLENISITNKDSFSKNYLFYKDHHTLSSKKLDDKKIEFQFHCTKSGIQEMYKDQIYYTIQRMTLQEVHKEVVSWIDELS